MKPEAFVFHVSCFMFQKKILQRKKSFLLFFILLLALFLRLYGINWDSGQHLHPDERFLTMVVTASRIPSSMREYLDPALSPLNPYNNNFPFYVYGTVPLTFTKIIARLSHLDSYAYITLVGRFLSALFDTATVFLIFCLVKLFEKKYSISALAKYLSAVLYAVAVLPIQQSHFFTVDSFAVFFTTAVAYFALRFSYEHKQRDLLICALFFGLALGTKLSSLYIGTLALVVIIIAPQKNNKGFFKKIVSLLIWLFVSYVVFRISDPHAFATINIFDMRISPQFFGNITQLSALSDSSSWYPPGLQWINKTRLIFPIKNIFFFGLGPVFFLMSVLGYLRFANFVIEKKIKGILKRLDLLFLLGWILVILVYQGLQPVMSIRYFYLLYPFFALLAGSMLSQINRRWAFVFFCFILLWPVSFMAIYTRPHTRVTASDWIYTHVPTGSVIATEHWDDSLPLSLTPDKVAQLYTIQQLPVFDPDTLEKWTKMNEILSGSNYLIFSSNRGYGSITTVPDKYPKMSKFYADLFANKLNFVKVKEFTSYPQICFPPKADQPWADMFYVPCFMINDQWADEAFTVYDHPKVTIFKRL